MNGSLTSVWNVSSSPLLITPLPYGSLQANQTIVKSNVSSSMGNDGGSSLSGLLSFTGDWTRERVVFWVSLAYVVISIVMVVLWSTYLCLDGRRSTRKDTRVIHMLAQRTVFRGGLL